MGRRPRAPKHLLSAEDAPLGTFAVIDPFSRMLFVPQASMCDTHAMHRPGVPSLCRLHMEGRCRQGMSCYQAHADVTVVNQLRMAALREPTCCATHGARSDAEGIATNLAIIVVGNDDPEELQRTTLARIAVTKGFRILLQKQAAEGGVAEPNAVTVTVDSLCRLHYSGPCCRFGHECNYVHLCRELVAEIHKRRNEKKSEPRNRDEAPQPTQPSPTGALTTCYSPPRSNTKLLTLGPEADCSIGVSPVQFFSCSGNFLTRPMAAGTVSLSGSPKLGTSPVLSRSYNSTSFGIVWRHNPYGGGSSASSVVET
ncbi:hypothetical protein TcG_05958 [Trypanosoma cruzi]|uniref:C3H1-type domain-containing protein n=2 Tax=Trypanosoma cruzi TaxID=5693 RepID=V5BI47_TRYCR|nr:hypothetical protein TCDM_07843 [Trypanosoma cruzi Dm28c]KAF8283060.1 hypothetical protein TcBrA4_0077010 [Trypanosoma cruzi]PBJ69641.1 hypothetical protein BCY84_19512 [Trypanosoma cruzi cruzi]PWU86103.1 hypothetical protein C4B63_133g32 [Trypanosoma cruzi]RNF16841.1 hypothetical protein TcG_05958 [Trypanosoma cruzi]